MKHLMLTLALLAMACGNLKAQDDPQYRMEIGGGVGLMGYLGDFNGNLTKDLQPMATVLARYVFNPYMALKMNVEFEEGADVKAVMQNVLKACKKVESDCEIFF